MWGAHTADGELVRRVLLEAVEEDHRAVSIRVPQGRFRRVLAALSSAGGEEACGPHSMQRLQAPY